MRTTAARSRQKTEPRLFSRQRQLLTLLDALGGRTRNLDFQKLLFLYCQEQGGEEIYEFVPYRFGAFSFTSYSDRRKLVDRGLLVDDEKYWELTDEAVGSLAEPRIYTCPPSRVATANCGAMPLFPRPIASSLLRDPKRDCRTCACR